MKHTIYCDWQNGLSFDAQIDGHKIKIDAFKENGGNDSGPSPKKLLLVALAGCTGMDVISILQKMKQPVSYFSMEIDANLTEEHPRVYSEIKIRYKFKLSDNLDNVKVARAIQLSRETYCGVGAMLGKASVITHEVLYL